MRPSIRVWSSPLGFGGQARFGLLGGRRGFTASCVVSIFLRLIIYIILATSPTHCLLSSLSLRLFRWQCATFYVFVVSFCRVSRTDYLSLEFCCVCLAFVSDVFVISCGEYAQGLMNSLDRQGGLPSRL
jgi:hypothetical protein